MWRPTLYSTTKVTLELRDVVENGVNLWNFEYPSYYTGAEKAAFEKKVIDHFYFRQIGQETVGRFLHCFRSRVREIMPRYVEMYKTVEIMHGIEDPFGNVDIVETYEEERTGSSSGTSSVSSDSETSENRTGSGDHERRFSNTPQGSIDNLDSYLTEATQEQTANTDAATGSSSGSSEGSSSETSEGTVKHTLTKKGNQGVNTYAHDMIEFRNAIIDVDQMIIDDLNCLFLQIY